MGGVGAGGGRAARFAADRPDRFALAVGGLNLLRPMKALGALESFVHDHPVAYATVGPSFWGDGMYPPSDAVYYPLYTKCCELDLPLGMNTGIPGPPLPAEPQDPIHLDRACIRFPELRLCMIHRGDTWWDTAIRLMLKDRNLRLMTSEHPGELAAGDRVEPGAGRRPGVPVAATLGERLGEGLGAQLGGGLGAGGAAVEVAQERPGVPVEEDPERLGVVAADEQELCIGPRVGGAASVHRQEMPHATCRVTRRSVVPLDAPTAKHIDVQRDPGRA
jgi:Amidohydrolase